MRHILLALCLIAPTVGASPPAPRAVGISMKVVAAIAPAAGQGFKAARVAPEGKYVIQPVACNHRHNRCIDLNGQPIGSIEDVLPKLPKVDAVDVTQGWVVCDRLCYDNAGHIVGVLPN